jgi:hypothetical protein
MTVRVGLLRLSNRRPTPEHDDQTEGSQHSSRAGAGPADVKCVGSRAVRHFPASHNQKKFWLETYSGARQ